MAAPKGLRAAVPSLLRTLVRLRPYLRRERMLLVGGTVALLAETAFRLLEPWPVKWVIDTVVKPGATATPARNEAVGLLLLAGLATLAVTMARAASSYLNTVAFAVAGTRAISRVRAAAYSHLLRLSLGYHGKSRTGDLVTRLVSDIGRLQDVAITAALPLTGNVVTLFGMSVVMLVLDWRLGAIVLCTFPLFFVTSATSSKRIHGAAREQRKREGQLAGVIAETLGAMRVVQSYTLERLLERRFSRSNDKTLREGARTTRLSASLERRTDVIVGAATALVLVVGGSRVLRGALTPGELVVFLSYLKSTLKPMRDVAKYTGRIAKAAASGERVIDVLDTEPDIVDAPDAAPAPRLQGAVRFEGVVATYGEGSAQRPALTVDSLEIPAGARVGIVGTSGSGKSTLAALLLRLLDPVEGRVLVDGVDVRTYTLESLRSQVAIVLQESVLFATSVRENISYGRPDATDEEIEAAARAANAHDFVAALPEGYDTVVGERGATLSGGQRQRIAIARAVLRDAPIVILDEATTGLDPDNSRQVLDALRRLTAGRTTLVISHDTDAVGDCDLVVRIEGGRVVGCGPPAEVLDADRALRPVPPPGPAKPAAPAGGAPGPTAREERRARAR